MYTNKLIFSMLFSVAARLRSVLDMQTSSSYFQLVSEPLHGQWINSIKMEHWEVTLVQLAYLMPRMPYEPWAYQKVLPKCRTFYLSRLIRLLNRWFFPEVFVRSTFLYLGKKESIDVSCGSVFEFGFLLGGRCRLWVRGGNIIKNTPYSLSFFFLG